MLLLYDSKLPYIVQAILIIKELKILKGIIFDMDGVIIDSEPIHYEIEQNLLKKLGGKLSKKEHATFIGTTDYNMWSSLKEIYNLEPSVEEIIDMKKELFLRNIDKIQLIDGFYDFMTMLYKKGYKLGLASSNNRKSVESIVEKFELDKYIEVTMSGEDVSKGKPDPEIFLTTAKKLSINPEDCIVVEDAENGVVAAKAAGMKCIALQGNNIGLQDLSNADIIIENFSELSLEQL